MYECHGLIQIVKEGDTMYKIAKMHHVSLWELMYENPYVNVYRLQPGDEICVPVSRGTDSKFPEPGGRGTQDF